MTWALIDRMMSRHLDDAALTDSLLAPTARRAAGDTAHLQRCAACRERLETLRQFVGSLNAASRSDFDAAYPAERLTSQRHRILRRIERTVSQDGPGRILRFPALAPPTLATLRRATGWLGMAAAAGLLVGIALGQVVRVVPGPTPDPTLTETTAERGEATLAVQDDRTTSDEEFLQEIELSLSTPQIWGLSPLDALTPRTREVAIDVR